MKPALVLANGLGFSGLIVLPLCVFAPTLGLAFVAVSVGLILAMAGACLASRTRARERAVYEDGVTCWGCGRADCDGCTGHEQVHTFDALGNCTDAQCDWCDNCNGPHDDGRDTETGE